MEVCGLCKDQAKNQKDPNPHDRLKRVGGQRKYIGWPTGGYEEQDYICQDCGTEFTYSNDENDYGWMLKTNQSVTPHSPLHNRARQA